MDDVYQINVAKSEFREAYNTGDVPRLLALYHKDCVNMQDSAPSAWGAAAGRGLGARVSALFEKYAVKLVPIVIDIVPCGDKMFDYGWHEFTLTPKAGGRPTRIRQRYMELWARNDAGEWKIRFFINNQDLRNEFNGSFASWFLSEGAAKVGAA